VKVFSFKNYCSVGSFVGSIFLNKVLIFVLLVDCVMELCVASYFEHFTKLPGVIFKIRYDLQCLKVM